MLLRCEASPCRGARREEPSEEIKGSQSRSPRRQGRDPPVARGDGMNVPLALVKAARVDKSLGFTEDVWSGVHVGARDRALREADESMKSGNIYLLIRHQLFKALIEL